MTGAEVIIKKGDIYILGKVRHSGYDVEEFFKKPDLFDIPFDDLWTSYLTWRRKGFSDISLGAEIETNFDKGYQTQFTDKPEIKPHLEKYINSNYYWKSFEDVLGRFHNLIEQIDEEDGLTCSYGDFQYYIDYDTKKVITQDDLITI